MRISLLLQREPFPDILVSTLEGFLEKRFGVQHTVTWHDGHAKGNGAGQVWLCNPLLNMFFVASVEREALLPAIQEFSRSTKPWRTPLQKLYTLLATCRLTSRFFASATLEISPAMENADQLVVVGGNHHIRLLDFQKGCCFVICKEGFSQEFLAEDLRVRLNHHELLVPRILEVSDDGSWYSEELILGTPINRLPNAAQAQSALDAVLPSLFKMYERTLTEIVLVDYCGALQEKIKKLVGENDLFDPTSSNDLLAKVAELGFIIEGSFNSKSDVITVQSHGDFQPANILLGDKGPWLIDWEYTARRQIGYDGLVYALRSRHPVGFSERVRQALSGEGGLSNLLDSWPHSSWNDQNYRRVSLALFLLEDLELKLVEFGNPLFRTLDVGFSPFFEELKRSVVALQEAAA